MTVTLEVPPALESVVQASAQAKGITVENYLLTLVERDAFAPPPGSENWTLQDALDYAGEGPEDLAMACAVASEDTLKKIWNSAEDEAAWHNIS